MMNVINGGKHAEGALQFQECMIVPLGARAKRKRCATARKSFTRSERSCTSADLPTLVGDEGGYAPPLETPQQALDLIVAGDRTRRLRAGTRRRDRARSGVERVLSRRQVLSALARSRRKRRRDDRALCGAVRTLSDRFDRRWSCRERLGRLAEAHRRARQSHPARRRRYLRHEHGVPRSAASTKASPTRSSSRSIKSARSPKRSTASRWRTRPATAR